MRWVAGVMVLIAAGCSTGTPNASAPAEPASTFLSATVVALHDDPRITPLSDLDPQDLCKIRQASTAHAPWGTTGFPRPLAAGDPTRDLRVLVVPLSAADAPFTSDDRARVELITAQASDYFQQQSYGRVQLDVTWADSPVEFAATVSELGWDAPGRVDRREAIRAAWNELRARGVIDVDVVSFFAPVDERYVFGVAESLPDPAPGEPTLTTFIGGRFAVRWATFAHELIHVWLGSPDLYDFSDDAVQFMGNWDIMAAGRGNLETNAWLRWVNGWVTDQQVRCVDGSLAGDSVHHVSALSLESSDPKMIVVRLTDHSALVIDSRRTVAYGVDSWDSDAPAALVYLVDTAIAHGAGPLRLRGELRAVGDTLATDGVTITLLDADSGGDLVAVTTTDRQPTLRFDPRLTPASALAAPHECKIPDITSDGAPTASGFPRDPFGIDPLSDLRLLIVPVSVNDSVFDDADLAAVNDVIATTTEYFTDQSYGKVGLEVDIAPRESWVVLRQTADSSGMANTTFGHDKTPLFRDTLAVASATLDLTSYDIVAVYAHRDQRFSFGQSIFDVDTPDGLVGHGVMVGGRDVSRWTLLAHEIVHTWLLAEDHYHDEQRDELMMGGWDIMDQSINDNFEINSWTRWINSWITDNQVRCITSPGETVHHLETISMASDEAKVVVVRLSDHSVLILDSRRDRRFIDEGWDTNGSAVAVYSVDTSIPHGQGPFRWRGDLRRVGQYITTDGVTITLLDADDTSDLVSVEVG